MTAFCPTCHAEDPWTPLERVRRLRGALIDVDGSVWLVRRCPEHGRVMSLYEEDAEILDELETWTAPPRRPTPDDPDNRAPIPAAYRRGLGASQRQHTCILLEDVVDGCNLRCPTCYADSSPARTGVASVADVLASVDRRIEREGGHLDVLMVSGGEPTLHPGLTALLAELAERDIVRVLLNTNGIQIARDDELLAFLSEHRERIEVYLQFDGFEGRTHRALRGGDLRELKHRAIERLSGAEVFTTLTMCAALGVNDHEIGDVVQFALGTPFVGNVCMQPVFGSGRGTGLDPIRRLTGTGVLRRLGPQTDGLVTWRDLTALPCSHPHCTSTGYLIRGDDGAWRSLVGLVGRDELRAHLDLVSNRMVFPGVVRELRTLVSLSLKGMLSEGVSMTHPWFRTMFTAVAGRYDLGIGGFAHRARLLLSDRARLRRLLGERLKRITIKSFMDVDRMIEERLLQCCVHVATAGEGGHACVPFCAAQAWPELADMKLSRVRLGLPAESVGTI